MAKFTIHQAKTQLSRLIQRALRGEEVVIANRDQPLVKLSAIQGKRRALGLFKGKVSIAPDFDAPLDDFKDYQ